MEISEISEKMKEKFNAQVLQVTKVSVVWSQEAEDFLEKEEFTLFGSILTSSSVFGVRDGIVVELYR